MDFGELVQGIITSKKSNVVGDSIEGSLGQCTESSVSRGKNSVDTSSKSVIKISLDQKAQQSVETTLKFSESKAKD